MLEIRIREMEYRRIIMIELTEGYIRIVMLEQIRLIREIVKIIELF